MKTINCDTCCKVIIRKSSAVRKHNFCSQKCHYTWRRTITGEQHPLYLSKKTNCTHCNSEIIKQNYTFSDRTHRFCNRKCQAEWKSKHQKGNNNPLYSKLTVNCYICNQEITRHPSHLKKVNKVFCSYTCFGVWYSKNKSGKNNPSWIHGQAYAPYTPEFNSHFKNLIRCRDGYRCILCRRTEKELGYALAIHHIDYNKLNSIPSNSVSLCRRDHSYTNFNRTHWVIFFQSLLRQTYNYDYETPTSINISQEDIAPNQTHE